MQAGIHENPEINLIEEQATVVERDGEHVWVEAVDGSGCSSCGASSRCGTGMLAGMLGKRRNLLRLRDHLNLQIGEQVLLGTPSGQLAKAAAVTYLLPLLLMVFASIGAGTHGFGDGGALVAALVGLMTGFLLVQRMSRRQESGLVQVQLLRRLHGAGGIPEQPIQFVK